MTDPLHPESGGGAARRAPRANAAVAIPIRNAAAFAARQIAALELQTVRPDRVIVIDSESRDGSAEVYRRAGYEVVSVVRQSFDHGGTRNLALTLAPEAEFLVYLTQDAVPFGRRTLESLLRRFDDPSIGIVYGRQLPREASGAIERHARWFNYSSLSVTRSMADAPACGIKTVFNSNSCAAYRRAALESTGGFPAKAIMGEDQIAAARILLAGWSIAYAADAEVVHSHPYALQEEFRRYFDIGVFHERNRPLLAHFGGAASEGRRFVRSEFLYLLRHAPARIPEAWARTVLKFVGYHLGRREAALPRAVKKRLAMQKVFFETS